MKTECMKTGICNVCGRMAFLYGLFVLFFAVAPYGACGASACVAADGAKTYVVIPPSWLDAPGGPRTGGPRFVAAVDGTKPVPPVAISTTALTG